MERKYFYCEIASLDRNDKPSARNERLQRKLEHV